MNWVLRHTRKECARNLCVFVPYLNDWKKRLVVTTTTLTVTVSFSGGEEPMVVEIPAGDREGVDHVLAAWLKQDEMEEESVWKETMDILWDPELLVKDVFLGRYKEELRRYRRVMLLEKCRSRSLKAEEVVKRLSTPGVGKEFLEDPCLSLAEWMEWIVCGLNMEMVQRMRVFRSCEKKEWMETLQPGSVAVHPMSLNTPEDWRKHTTAGGPTSHHYVDVDRFLLGMDGENCLSSAYDVTLYQHEHHPRLAFLGIPGLVRRTGMVTRDDIVRHAAAAEYRGYHPSSASMAVLSDNEMLILQRSVNYTIIHETGAYIYDGQVKTQNYWLRCEKNLYQEATWKPFTVPESFSLRKGYILGMEDMRVFAKPSKFPDRLYAMATTVEYGAMPHTPCQVLCILDKDGELQNVVDIDFETGRCQKNWCPYFTSDGRLMLIYGWNPNLTIVEVLLDEHGKPIVKDAGCRPPKVEYRVHTIPFTTQCKRLDTIRGSTSPIYIPETDEWYLMVHEVYHIPNVPTRRYRHRVLSLPGPLLDRVVMTPDHKVRIGVPIVMEDNQIEYTLGMAVMNQTVYVHYSVWDNSSNMIEIPQGSWLQWFRENSTAV